MEELCERCRHFDINEGCLKDSLAEYIEEQDCYECEEFKEVNIY